jgi:hypothetical protein
MVERVISYCNIKTIGWLPFVNVASSEDEILQQLLRLGMPGPAVNHCLISLHGLPPVSHLSNQPTICLRRLDAVPQLAGNASSRDSPGNFTITVGMLRNFKGRGFEPRRLKEGEPGQASPYSQLAMSRWAPPAAKRCVWGGDDRVGKRAAAAGHAELLVFEA